MTPDRLLEIKQHANLYDFEVFDALLDQTDVAASTGGGRNNLPIWICKNTSHPKHLNREWSFKGHEYQLGILECAAPHIAVQKAAQIGISEISVRALLALSAKLSGEQFIYVLPTTKFASKFASTRIDPVIKASKRLQVLASKDVDSTELKKIGSCYIHIGGAHSDRQAISIPARGLFIDEYSFCNPSVISTYQSRLGHNLPEDRIRYDFSTPLFSKSGITEQYQKGTQHIYMCFHDRCGQWVEVNALNHLKIPGWDDPLEKLLKQDLSDPAIKVEETYVQCEHCHSEITRANLADPAKRAWVPRHPDREIHSFNADALVAAAFRAPAQVVSDLEVYRRTDTWIRYGLGYEFESADSQIIEAARESCFLIGQVKPGNVAVYGSVAGADIGKISYLCHGRRYKEKLHIFHIERVRQDEENNLGNTFVGNFNAFGSVRGVIDAAPDVSIVKHVQGRTRHNAVWGAYFIRSTGNAAATLEIAEEDEKTGMVKIRRTAAIDDFVADFNRGDILLPKGMGPSIEKEVKDHLERPKRIVNEDALGEESAVWVSKGADHWFFALFYCWLAARRIEDGTSVILVNSASNILSKVKMRSK